MIDGVTITASNEDGNTMSFHKCPNKDEVSIVISVTDGYTTFPISIKDLERVLVGLKSTDECKYDSRTISINHTQPGVVLCSNGEELRWQNNMIEKK